MANFLQSFLQNLTKKRPRGFTSPNQKTLPPPKKDSGVVTQPRTGVAPRGGAVAPRPNYAVTPSVARPNMKDMGYVEEVAPKRLPGPGRKPTGPSKGLTAAAAVGAAGLAYNGSGGQGAEWSGPSIRPVAGKPQQATPRKGGPGRSPTGPRPKASPVPHSRPAQAAPSAPAARSQVTASAPQSPKVTLKRTPMDDEYGSYYTGQAQRNKKFGRIDR